MGSDILIIMWNSGNQEWNQSSEGIFLSFLSSIFDFSGSDFPCLGAEAGMRMFGI